MDCVGSVAGNHPHERNVWRHFQNIRVNLDLKDSKQPKWCHASLLDILVNPCRILHCDPNCFMWHTRVFTTNEILSVYQMILCCFCQNKLIALFIFYNIAISKMRSIFSTLVLFFINSWRFKLRGAKEFAKGNTWDLPN